MNTEISFKNVKSLADLKNQYRSLAFANHPDHGGSEEAMKIINAEYDRLYAIWINRLPEEARPADRTGEESRVHFYTAYGWAGERYDSSLGTKAVAERVRQYLKGQWPQWKFHVRCEYFSGGSSIYLTLVGGPCECPITSDDQFDLKWGLDVSYRNPKEALLTELAAEVMADAVGYLTSYRYDDSDGMIDYFSTNFYVTCKVAGREDWKEVHKTARLKAHHTSSSVTVSTPKEDAAKSPKTDEITDEMRYIAERTCLKAEIRRLKRELRALDRKYPQYVPKKK